MTHLERDTTQTLALYQLNIALPDAQLISQQIEDRPWTLWSLDARECCVKIMMQVSEYFWEIGIQLTSPGWVIAQVASQGKRLRETLPISKSQQLERLEWIVSKKVLRRPLLI